MNDTIEMRKLIDQLEEERVEVGNCLWLLDGRVKQHLEDARLFDEGSVDSRVCIAQAAAVNDAVILIRSALAKLGGNADDDSV